MPSPRSTPRLSRRTSQTTPLPRVVVSAGPEEERRLHQTRRSKVVTRPSIPFSIRRLFSSCLLSLSSRVRLAINTVIFSSSFLSSPHVSLTAFSPTHSIFRCCSPFSSHSSRYHLTRSSHRIPSLPRLLFPSTFWSSDPFANFSSPNLSTCPAYFSLLLTSALQTKLLFYYKCFRNYLTLHAFHRICAICLMCTIRRILIDTYFATSSIHPN